jgi:hypothetical protein
MPYLGWHGAYVVEEQGAHLLGKGVGRSLEKSIRGVQMQFIDAKTIFDTELAAKLRFGGSLSRAEGFFKVTSVGVM